jgi:hypothetical protein
VIAVTVPGYSDRDIAVSGYVQTYAARGGEGSLRRFAMARCEVCGNDYYLSFQVIAAGQTHTFDSFECAIHKLAPVCDHCGCRIVGHGMEAEGTFFCCAHCAREAGVTAVADHV